MPDTVTHDPKEVLAKLLALAQMSRDDENTGQCGQSGEWCFQLFAPTMRVAETGNAPVDAALTGLRDALLGAWQQGSSAVAAAANANLPGSGWAVEWAFHEDGVELICTRPSG